MIVTFLLEVSVPNNQSRRILYYRLFTRPLFQANEFSTGQAPLSQGNTSPPDGQWQMASDDTLSNLSGIIPSLVVDVHKIR